MYLILFILNFNFQLLNILGNSEINVSPNPINEIWKLKKIEGQNIIFENKEILKTNLFELDYLGQINKSESPYFLISGRDCKDCGANVSLYIHSISNGALKVENGENSYSYPGTTEDYLTGEIIEKSRVFYGEVLNNKFGVIWFQTEYESITKTNSSIFFVEILNNKLTEIEIENNDTTLNETLMNLKNGKCFEVKGVEKTSEP